MLFLLEAVLPPTVPLIVARLLMKVPLPAHGEALLLLKAVSNSVTPASAPLAVAALFIKVPFAAFEAFKKIMFPPPSAAIEIG
jgi:hypothetical protein